MYPNPYVVEEMARQKEAEMQRLAKDAWARPPRRPAVGQRLLNLLVIGVIVSCGFIWMLP